MTEHTTTAATAPAGDDGLVAPHGGRLVDLRVGPERAAELEAASRDWPEWTLTARQRCDLELLADGGFSPLTGFMGRADYDAVRERMRLADGTLWPIPVVLDVAEELVDRLETGGWLALRDPEGVMLAALRVDDVWPLDRAGEAEDVYGTVDPDHPGVAALVHRTEPMAVSGQLEVLHTPAHHDFTELRRTPAEVRRLASDLGWRRMVAFQTRNPMHRAHVELTLRAAEEADAGLLVHPVVGTTKPGDVDHFTRVRCYRAVLDRYPPESALLSLLPLSMRMAGPREAVWHAIIRKNHGCSHLIVGRDHAGPGSDASGTPFYGPYDAQELLRDHQDELGVAMVPFRQMVYLPDEDRYAPDDEVGPDVRTLSLSGTELRARLAAGREVPEWFTYPEVATELRRTHPPRHRQGVTLLLTGLSGSGKSTVANALQARLLERGDRTVTLLDGDLVRRHLSSELGFSRRDRDLNITRIGWVASEITRHGGVAICCPIAPYDETRKRVREMVEQHGGFVLVHLATPLEVCEERDRKGLYAKARAGLIEEFTGISDPYEEPDDAEVRIDTTDLTVEQAAQRLLDHLEAEGYLTTDADGS